MDNHYEAFDYCTFKIEIMYDNVLTDLQYFL